MMRNALALSAVALAYLGLSSPAAAQAVDYTLTCTSSATVCDAVPVLAGNPLTFTVAEFPTPSSIDQYVGSFTFNAVPCHAGRERHYLDSTQFRACANGIY